MMVWIDLRRFIQNRISAMSRFYLLVFFGNINLNLCEKKTVFNAQQHKQTQHHREKEKKLPRGIEMALASLSYH